MELALGVDIGGTNTRVGAVTEDATVVSRHSFDTAVHRDADSFADALTASVHQVMATAENELGEIRWAGLGIGAPNANFHKGTIEAPPNLNFKGITPMVNLLSERIDLPFIAITNDANAAALGEKFYGAAKDVNNFIMVTLGTGLGSGYFVNGKLVYGHDGFAGELGHVTVVPGGRYCGYGRRGSLETYCSATGIVRTFFEMIALHNKPTLLDDVPVGRVTSKSIANAAAEGDFIATETFEFTGDLLGKALASFALTTSPEKFFLFGGPLNSGELILKPARSAYEANLIDPYKGKSTLEVSALPMGDAAILGAAALVRAEK
ncbi:MAG: ROK family protein [Verrucomicrobiota bacterium]